MLTVSEFIEQNFRCFNSGVLRDAAVAYRKLIDEGGKMLVSLGGAVSTAEIGRSLSEMIYSGKVHAICSTGANIEEDIFHLFKAAAYKRVPWRSMSPAMDDALARSKLCRVLDTCIPESVMDDCIAKVAVQWSKANEAHVSRFPHEFLFDILSDVDSSHPSWVLAARDCNVPIFVPGWEDSTIGNAFVARVALGQLDASVVKSGVDYMLDLIKWYKATQSPVGFFQIGGGIAGDFAICAVPLINQEMPALADSVVKYSLWSYFCSITDSVESYGSYSGAAGSEKISWAKLEKTAPMFTVNSDATIVAPLIFAYVMGW
jgi:deoxyhypusine synthase